MVRNHCKRGACNVIMKFGHTKDKGKQLPVCGPIPRFSIIARLTSVSYGMAARISALLLQYSGHMSATEVGKKHKMFIRHSQGEHRGRHQPVLERSKGILLRSGPFPDSVLMVRGRAIPEYPLMKMR